MYTSISLHCFIPHPITYYYEYVLYNTWRWVWHIAGGNDNRVDCPLILSLGCVNCSTENAYPDTDRQSNTETHSKYTKDYPNNSTN